MSGFWPDLKFPPINLWNYPKQYCDIPPEELSKWCREYLEYKNSEKVLTKGE